MACSIDLAVSRVAAHPHHPRGQHQCKQDAIPALRAGL